VEFAWQRCSQCSRECARAAERFDTLNRLLADVAAAPVAAVVELARRRRRETRAVVDATLEALDAVESRIRALT